MLTMRLLFCVGTCDLEETRMRHVPEVGDRVADLIEAKEYVVAEVVSPAHSEDKRNLYVVRLRPRSITA